MELFFDGPAGRLEAVHEPPRDGGEPRAAAIVCHPHPLFGGTMDNTVVFRVSRALLACGCATLRFNFRGAGRSEGEHHGAGEEERDAAAALDWLAERYPGAPLVAAGFSFGARTVAGLALADTRVSRLICVALPVDRFECRDLERLAIPAYFLFAGEDEFGTLASLRRRFPELPARVDTDEIEGTDHFFRRRTPELEERVRRWAEASLAETT